jgi:hypothetical protein
MADSSCYRSAWGLGICHVPAAAHPAGGRPDVRGLRSVPAEYVAVMSRCGAQPAPAAAAGAGDAGEGAGWLPRARREQPDDVVVGLRLQLATPRRQQCQQVMHHAVHTMCSGCCCSSNSMPMMLLMFSVLESLPHNTMLAFNNSPASENPPSGQLALGLESCACFHRRARCCHCCQTQQEFTPLLPPQSCFACTGLQWFTLAALELEISCTFTGCPVGG